MLLAYFAHIFVTLEQMQQHAAESAFFLPLYELRQSKLALDELKKKLDSVKERLLPKKKFEFRSRKIKETTVEEQGKTDCSVSGSPVPSGNVTDGADLLRRIDQQTTPALKISALKDKTIFKGPGSIGGSDVVLSDLDTCSVSLKDISTALRVNKLSKCVVVSGPVSGSFFVEGASDCVFVIASRQVRIHEAHNCDFYLAVMSKPIIEHSANLRFAPYPLEYPELDGQLAAAGLVPARANELWNDVQDFNWLRQQHSPNWSELLPQDRQSFTEEGELK